MTLQFGKRSTQAHERQQDLVIVLSLFYQDFKGLRVAGSSLSTISSLLGP
jgi:hypothetical protein